MQVHQNYPLRRCNTFGIAAVARYFSTFSSAGELGELLEDKKDISARMILGGGSNILFTGNYDGFILKNEIQDIQIVREDNEFVYIRAGAGVKWHSFVMHCVDRNLGGVENLSLIPGNAGATPLQNIGAYGVEIRDVFHELEAFHLEEKFLQRFSGSDCEFGYRDSIFKNKYRGAFAILQVTYRLKKVPVLNISYGAIREELAKMNVDQPDVRSVSEAVIRIRTSKLPDPAVIGNAGSFFKNPVITKTTLEEIQKQELIRHGISGTGIPFFALDADHCKIPAGWLVEQCGWKGFRRGDVGCYDKQALVLVNYGHASGREIYRLSEEIQISVKEKFGIELEREVNVV
jgi:UDP-N-acetylmuramate dehydrogenase